MNVAQVMKKSLFELNEGLDNINLHLTPQLEDAWDDGYALVNGLYYDEFSEYFDHERFRSITMSLVNILTMNDFAGTTNGKLSRCFLIAMSILCGTLKN